MFAMPANITENHHQQNVNNGSPSGVGGRRRVNEA
jgi:hypothetical protein